MNIPETARAELSRIGNRLMNPALDPAERATLRNELNALTRRLKATYSEHFHLDDASLWTREFMHQPMGGNEFCPSVVPMRGYRIPAVNRVL